MAGITGGLTYSTTQVGQARDPSNGLAFNGSAAVFAVLTNYQSTPVTFNSVGNIVSPFGGGAPQFTWDATGPLAGTCAAGVPVPPNGGQCSIRMQFTPNAVNSFLGIVVPWLQTATVSLTDSGGVNPLIAMVGTASNSALSGAAGFGNQQVGTTQAAHTFTFKNSGATSVTIGAGRVTLMGTNPANYALVNNLCSGATVLAGGNCTIGVTFTPSATGSRSATLNVNDGAGIQTLDLTGIGLQAAVGFSWPYVGTVGVWGTATGARTITVTNTGTPNSTLTLSAIPAVANPPGGNQFSRTGGTCGATTGLTQNQTCTVIITRNRPAARPFGGTGTLTVTDTGAAAASQVLNLSGS